MQFAGGCIDALALCEGDVLRTADPDSVSFGVAQVRRGIFSRKLSLLHLVFAPAAPRPLLLGVVCLNNRTAEPVGLDYTELWDVMGEDYQAGSGASSCRTPEGIRALADVSMAVRTVALESPGLQGLALHVRIVLPPNSFRHLFFAYAAPPPEEDPALLVRAWRGDVLQELERTVARFEEGLPANAEPVAAYRASVVTLSS